jgi:uncharacterized protein (DUF2147 family)
MKKIVYFLSLCFLLSFTSSTFESPQESWIVGKWLTGKKDAHVEIFKNTSGKYIGKIVWLKTPIDPETQKPKLDKHNPETSQRNQALLGLFILKNFTYKEEEFVGGTIYDPKEGKLYQAKMWQNSRDVLYMRGYWGIFYKTEEWTRVK